MSTPKRYNISKVKLRTQFPNPLDGVGVVYNSMILLLLLMWNADRIQLHRDKLDSCAMMKVGDP